MTREETEKILKRMQWQDHTIEHLSRMLLGWMAENEITSNDYNYFIRKYLSHHKTKEEDFQNIAEILDELPEHEQDFTLWYLLQRFIRKGNKELAQEPRTKEEYMCFMMTSRLVKAAEEIREVIGYEIF